MTAGAIDHVIRFTAPRMANAYVWPASHKAATGGAADPPMGAWLRLKASFDISSYSATEPGDPPRAQEARHGARRQRLARLHERRPRSGLEQLGSERPPDDSGLGLRGGRRVVAEGVEHVVRRGEAVREATPPPAPSPASTASGRARDEPRLRGEPRRLGGRGTASSTIARTCAVSHTRLVLGRAGSASADGSATRVIDDSPNTVSSTAAGATYGAAAWVQRAVGADGDAAPRQRERRHGRPHETRDGDGDRELAAVRGDERRRGGRDVLGVEIVVAFSWTMEVRTSTTSR